MNSIDTRWPNIRSQRKIQSFGSLNPGPVVNMRRPSIAQVFYPIYVLIICLIFLPRMADGQVTSNEVKEAIRDAVSYLTRQQNANGTWDDWTNNEKLGVTALATFSLLNAGVDPEAPVIKKATSALKRMNVEASATYSIAFQTMVLCLENPKANLVLIQKNVEWFEERQWKGNTERAGGWGYNHKGRDISRPDNSISQVALLALHEAQIAGAKVKPETWTLAKKYWELQQNLNGARGGGFGYENGSSGELRGSMTAAGISSLIIATENSLTVDDILENGRIQCCGKVDVDDHYRVSQAIKWITTNYSVAEHPITYNGKLSASRNELYYLYSLERAGRLAGIRFFGEHDWYREGADHLVNSRGGKDYWSFFHDGRKSDIKVVQNTIGTSFALLFLSKGLRPIVVGKYQHGTDEDWNIHRKGIHFLTRETEIAWNRKLNWQTIDGRRASVNDLLEAPVLFISGKNSFQLTKEQKENLKEYVNQGGFIFAEACQGDGCDPGQFDKEFRAVMAELFNNEFELIPPNHPVWNANEKVTPNEARPIFGLQACCRTSVIYCPANLTCFWQLTQPRFKDQLTGFNLEQVEFCRKIGVNVLTYATNRELRDRLDRPKIDSSIVDDVSPDQIEVAKILHDGGADDAGVALQNLMQTARRETSIPFSLKKSLIRVTDAKAYQYPILFIHGRFAFEFTDEERLAIRKMVKEKGFFLFADSVCASKPFADSFRREMKAIFPDENLELLKQDHPIFGEEFGSDIRDVVLRTPISSQDRNNEVGKKYIETKTLPQLEAITIGKSVAVIFSPNDLSCALENAKSVECKGYPTDDAARIGINILRYALNREIPD